MKNREELASYFNELGFKYGAEIGVATGKFSKVLCDSIPGLELLCVDPYISYPDDTQRFNQDKVNKFMEEAQERLKPYRVSFIRRGSLDAVKDIIDESLDFVYIDANHKFDYVIQDIITWTPKVRKGGIVAGHDYERMRNFGVVEAVNAYTGAHNIPLNIIKRDEELKFNRGVANWWFIKI